MKTQTHSTVTHRTSLTADRKVDDGGKSLLSEAFDFIREEKQRGKLVAVFGPGGSIRSLMFEEEDTIPQRDIEIAE